jgi:uncharacterized protein YggU (UPF0235/DUF167 family)
MKIFVKAKPSAKEGKIEKIDDTHFVVSVRELPKQDKANKAIVKALAEHFNISPSRIRLIFGFSSKQKVFEVA